MKLSLSVLDCKDIPSTLKELNDLVDYVHLDVMDGILQMLLIKLQMPKK